MKKFIFFIFCFSISIVSTAQAGLVELTWHSRANCVGFNESITWDARWYRVYRTKSHHAIVDEHGGKASCNIDTGWEDTWRSAAYHSPEGFGGWHVEGKHWMKGESGRDIFLGDTEADDCNIYDGWWDH